MDFNLTLENIKNKQFIGGDVFTSNTPYKVTDFSICSNILPPPKQITKQLKSCDLSVKPDITCEKAMINLSKRHEVDVENIIIEHSIFSLLSIILKSLKARSSTVVMPCETFYKKVCKINSCDVLPFVMQKRHNFKLDCDNFIETVTNKSDVVILSNPCRVTGRIISKSDMSLILDYCQSKGIYVIIDETFMDFALTDQSVADLIYDFHNLLVLRSPTAYYNLEGLSAAYCVTSSEVAEIIKSNQLPWQNDTLSYKLCETAYNFPKHDLKTKKWIFAEKKDFINKLKSIDSVEVMHSDCHYVLMSLGEVSATTIYNRLLKSNILIRDASDFTGLDGSYIRVAIKDKKSNDKFIEELMRCLI